MAPPRSPSWDGDIIGDTINGKAVGVAGDSASSLQGATDADRVRRGAERKRSANDTGAPSWFSSRDGADEDDDDVTEGAALLRLVPEEPRLALT